MKEAPEVKMSLLKYYRMAVHNPIGLRTKIFAEYGDIAKYKLRGFTTYYVAHPNYIKRILQDNQDNYLPKHPIMDLLIPVMGKNSLFVTSDLDQWHRDRITANISFDPKVYFNDYAATISRLALNMFERWKKLYKNEQYIDVNKEIGLLILSIMTQTLLMEKADPEVLLNIINEISRLLRKKSQTIPLIWTFSASKRNCEKKLKFLRKWMKEIVEKRLTGEVKWDDLLGQYLHEYKNSSKEEIIELLSYHIASFAAVGYFTTSALVHWTLVELSRNPEIERRIVDEVNHVLSDRLPTYNDLASLKYLSSVIKEVLRLHPTAYTIGRKSISSDMLGEFYIPQGVGVIGSVYHIHRHPDYWIDPEGFDPERFQKNPLGQSDPFAYIPFGPSQNKRRCPGSAFSTMEVILIIAMLVQRFQLHLPPNAEVKPFITSVISMRPNVDMMRLIFKR